MNNEIYIDHVLDEYLRGKYNLKEVKQLLLNQEQQINTDEAIVIHTAAIATLQRNAVLTQVNKIHTQFITARQSLLADKIEIPAAKTGKTIRMQPLKWMLRIAAVFIFMAGGWFAYQYSSANSSKLYVEIYQPYNVNIDRAGIDEIVPHNMIQQYRGKDYKAVISTFQSLSTTNNREKFLAATAWHETGSYQNAIDLLAKILHYNQQQGSRLYNDEAEFFMGLSYLKMKNGKEAIKWFQKIYDDPFHTFHERVSKWTLTRLKWLK